MAITMLGAYLHDIGNMAGEPLPVVDQMGFPVKAI
jgi:hypothetical protein